MCTQTAFYPKDSYNHLMHYVNRFKVFKIFKTMALIKYQEICCINRFTSLCKNLFNLLEILAEAFRPLGQSSIENDARGIEKLLLKSQVSCTSSCIVK